MNPDRNLWPLGIVLVFALFFAGIIAVIIIASTRRDALVSDNYYEQELKFQRQIDAAGRAIHSGAGVRLDAAAGKIVVTLPAEQVKQDFSGKIFLYRASASAMDREFPLAPDNRGAQALDISRLPAGPWQVNVRWNAGGREYFLELKIVI
jgi:nitrogen fixation protein FixH